MKNTIKKVIILIIVLLLAYVINNNDFFREYNFRKSEPTFNLNNKEDFMIYFIDVGEADCTLIFNNGEYSLIDAGNNEDGDKLVKFMKSIGVTDFKYVITTHAHEDHMGGMDNIIRNFNVENFFIPDVKVNTRTYTEVIDELKNKNIPVITPDVDLIFTMSEAKFRVLSISNEEEDLNDTSIVLKLNFKNTSYLFTGDATKKVELNILDKDLKSDVLKVGHHGGATSTSAQFLKAVSPKYAVISVGKNNDYNHPNKITLDKLNYLNIKTYRTDNDGTVVLSSNGKDIFFETIKTDTNN